LFNAGLLLVAGAKFTATLFVAAGMRLHVWPSVPADSVRRLAASARYDQLQIRAADDVTNAFGKRFGIQIDTLLLDVAADLRAECITEFLLVGSQIGG
jgi:hypothetical protein